MAEEAPAVVFTFGRFQPPTTGHRRLIEAIIKIADENKGDARVYISKKVNASKNMAKSKNYANMRSKHVFKPLDILENPLSSDEKLAILSQQYAGKSVTFHPESTYFSVISALKKEGKMNLILVLGTKRAAEMEEKLKPYHPDVKIVSIDRPKNKSSAEKASEEAIPVNNSNGRSVSKEEIEAELLTAEEESEAGMSSSALRKAAIEATPHSIQFFLRHIVFGAYTRDQAMGVLNAIRAGMGYPPITYTGGTRKRRKNQRRQTKKRA
jgi:hypothetical protein